MDASQETIDNCAQTKKEARLADAYRDAIKNCAQSLLFKSTKMDAFDLSTAMAVAFGVDKLKTINDILNTQKKIIEDS